MSTSEKIKCIIMAIIMIVALVISYVRQTRKMQSYDLKELYKRKDMGEGLLNFFGSLYIPVVFFLLSYVREEYKLFIFCLTTTILIFLTIYFNIKIYRYKKQIRFKDKYQKQAYD